MVSMPQGSWCNIGVFELMQPAELIITILTSYLGLSQDRVFQGVQGIKPKLSGINVMVKEATSQVIGSKSTINDQAQEVSSVVLSTPVDCEIFGKDYAVVERKEEILMAISSVFAQQLCDEHSMRIDRQGSIMDLSRVEGAQAMHRYRIGVIVKHMKQKSVSTELFYDETKLQTSEVKIDE